MEPMPDGFDAWLTRGPEDDDCAGDETCACDKCNGEPEDDSDIEINDKPREGVRENWTGA